MTTIEISKIEPPGYNKKTATLTDSSGDTWKAKPEILIGLEVGRRYQVEFYISEFQGKKYKFVTKAYPADPVAGNGNGHADSTRNYPPNEQQFVTTLLAAFITSGQIKPQDKAILWETVKMLRGCYAATFGQETQRTH